MLGLKGLLVDFVLRHVKKMVPAVVAAGRDPAVRRARRRPQAARSSACRSSTTTSRSCSTPAARPASPRARCCCTATSSPTCCRRARGCGRSSTRRRARSIITPLPLYHIFSLTANCLVFMTLGGENVLIPNPRDIPGFVKEMRQLPLHRDHRRQHAVQRAAQQPRVRASSISRRCGSRSAAAWRCRRRSRERWKEVTGVPLIEAYGLTETSPAATINPLDLPTYNGSIGLPIPSTDIELRDDAGQRRAARPARRDLHQGPAGDGRLLAAARRDGQGDDAGRLLRAPATSA